MKKWFYSLNIRRRLTYSITTVNIFFGIICILFLIVFDINSKNFATAYNEYAKTATNVASASAAYQNALAEAEQAVMSAGTAKQVEATETVNEAVDKMKDAVKGIDEGISDVDLKSEYDDIKSAADNLYGDLGTIVQYVQNGQYTEADKLINSEDFAKENSNMAKAFSRMLDDCTAKGDRKVESVQNNVLGSKVLLIVLFVAAVGFDVLIIMWLSRSLKKPIYNMRDAADKMAVGDVDVEIVRFGNDELGELADSLKKMQANVRNQAEVAREISEGNLEMEFESNGERDLLGNSMATMLSEENRVMGSISEAVMEIKTGSQEVASASQSLAQGSTEQASAIQQITASISDISERTRVNAEDANEANRLVTQAKGEANDSNAKMQEMIVAMTDINNSSENISKIIKVIDDIAFQTNILALNAAVEAARAGAHGRGFAVVADEVRNLAGKSAQAASETAELIEDSINKVQKGSKLAEETAEALEGIVAAVDKIVSITNSIAVASNDQATAIDQIDKAIGQVSQVVQMNSATSEQCAAASEELSAQAGKLREMIGRYRLKKISVEPSRIELEETNEPIRLTPVNRYETASKPEPVFRSEPMPAAVDHYAVKPNPVSDPEPKQEEVPDLPLREVPPVISLDEGFGKY